MSKGSKKAKTQAVLVNTVDRRILKHAALPKYVGSPLDEFDTAFATVTQRRGKIYGHPYVNMRRLDTMLNVVEECDDPIIKRVLSQIVNKVARLIESPKHIDSAVDIAGYARVLVMCIQRRNGYPDNPPTPEGSDSND